MPDKHVATLNCLRSPYTAIRHCVPLELSGRILFIEPCVLLRIDRRPAMLFCKMRTRVL